MFKIETVRGNDSGDDLDTLLSSMKEKGYKLVKIVPNEFETFVHDKPQKYVGNIQCTGELRVSTYLCIFEDK